MLISPLRFFVDTLQKPIPSQFIIAAGFLLSLLSFQSIAQGVDFKSETTRDKLTDNQTVYKTYYKKGINLPSYDSKLIHYGFYVGSNVSSFNIDPSQYYVSQLTDTLYRGDSLVLTGINAAPNLGFTTGFIFSVRLNEYVDIRFLPAVSFFSRFVEFKRRDNRIFNQLNRFTFSFIELPIMVKFKSQRRQNTRGYLIAGIKPSFEVGSRRDEQGADELRANSTDLTVDVGAGFDLYYPYFKFSPELRFSFGLADLKYPDMNRYSRSINRMSTYTVSFLMNFE